jgi:predicted  nucleic acid-binding Zn-ribbon protein
MPISVKNYCERWQCDYGGIYKKIRRKLQSGELSELNVYKEHGKLMLDDKAERVLRPVSKKDTAQKISELETAVKVYQRSDYDTQCQLSDVTERYEELQKAHNELNEKYQSLQAEYQKLTEEHNQKISECENYESQIEEYQKQIEELTAKKKRRLF